MAVIYICQISLQDDPYAKCLKQSSHDGIIFQSQTIYAINKVMAVKPIQTLIQIDDIGCLRSIDVVELALGDSTAIYYY